MLKSKIHVSKSQMHASKRFQHDLFQGKRSIPIEVQLR